jgi:hypothetical protein
MAWRGQHIQVTETATARLVWSWWRRYRCHRDLYDGRDISAGLDYRCIRRITPAEASRLRRAAREGDRTQYRGDQPS